MIDYNAKSRAASGRTTSERPMRRRVVGTVALATVGVLGLSPAYGDLLGTLGGNSLGSAGATTGNNTSAGNGGGNTPGSGGGTSGLLGLNLGLGGATSTQNGTSNIESGSAGATGNSTSASSSGFSGPVPLAQGAALPVASAPPGFSTAAAPGVLSPADAIIRPTGSTSSGFANADTGNNTSAGNGGGNTAGSGAVSGGLLGLNLSLGGPTATQNGTSTIKSGSAGATGNSSGPSAAAAALGLGGNCVSGPAVAALNSVGSASANTGGNKSAGNAGGNTASNPSVTGGLLGLNISLGGPTAVQNGTSDITTGSAGAEGNKIVTPSCPGAPVFVSQPPVYIAPPQVHTPNFVPRAPAPGKTLAVTGANGRLGFGALLTLAVGAALTAVARRRRDSLASAMGVTASSVGSEWDAVVAR